MHCSTIGAGGLNFSVRNGKRWDTAAITTWNVSLIAVRTPCIPHAKGRRTTGGNRKGLTPAKTSTAGKKHARKTWNVSLTTMPHTPQNDGKKEHASESFGQLVMLGFDVTVFTPASYRRPRLGRPSRSSNLAAGFALRCFQRLSDPDSDTRRCAWRHNR